MFVGQFSTHFLTGFGNFSRQNTKEYWKMPTPNKKRKFTTGTFQTQNEIKDQKCHEWAHHASIQTETRRK
jgi:hypothetical protein